MKKFYFVVTVEENGFYYCYVKSFTSSYNIASFCTNYGGENMRVVALDIHESKKRAIEICNFRNACFEVNGESILKSEDCAPCF